MESPTVVGAQVANELLNITGVEASFVFTVVKGVIYVSARSYDSMNVQLVMERLGGGGHSTMAGTQLKDMTVEEAEAKMKVILIEDVKTLGKKGDTVNVNDGYARNFILPKKLGIEATAKNINDLKLQKANEEKVAKEILEAAKAFAEDIKEKSVTVTIKTGEGGKTFGSVSSKEIAAAYKSQLNIEIDKKKLQLAEPVRSLGVYKVPYKVHPKVTAELTVKVAEA